LTAPEFRFATFGSAQHEIAVLRHDNCPRGATEVGRTIPTAAIVQIESLEPPDLSSGQISQPNSLERQPTQSREKHSRGLTGMSSLLFRRTLHAGPNQSSIQEKFTAVHL